VPITITIETFEEAEYLWYRLNGPASGRISYDMFCAFDDVFHLEWTYSNGYERKEKEHFND
jgi:hypothetical protein